jgi:uncharacterized protein (DUF924 family)
MLKRIARGMTARILASLFLSLAMAACTGQGSRPVADTDVAARNAAVAPTPHTSVLTERDRESWLALTDAAAMDVLRFWFEEWDQDRAQGGKGRYNDKWFPHGPLGTAGSVEIDREIRERYLALFRQAVAGDLDWAIEENPYENLAFILLIDQFARNMFRGTPQAYEHDALGLAAARTNVEKGFFHYYFTGYQKLFVVYPLMHHESLASQDSCMYLLKAINESPGHPYQFLNAMYKGMEHRQVIFMFGRFPHRNERLGRPTTPMEQAYLDMKGTKGFIDGSKW